MADKKPWVLEVPQEGGEAKVYDPITRELVFEGGAVHCLAWIRTATVPELSLERAKHAMVAGVQSMMKEIGDGLVAKGLVHQHCAQEFLAKAVWDWMVEEELNPPEETTH